jgi:hypothetical protein
VGPRGRSAGFGTVGQAVLDPAFAMRLGELGHQRRRPDELHRIAGQDRLAPDCYRKVRLADTGRP